VPVTDFTVKKEFYGPNLICLRLIGTVDAHTTKRLDRAVDEIMKGKVWNIIIDLSALNFISSSGLGVIVSLVPHVESRKGKLILAGTQAKIKEVFDALGLSKMFTFAPDVMAARKLME
jgi:anti-anti-sigma factor